MPEKMIESIADDAKEQIALEYIQRLIDGDFEALVEELEPTLQTSNAVESLEKLSSYIPKEAPSTTNLVGYHYARFGDRPPRYNLTYQFGYGSKWVLANAAWDELPDGSRVIAGLSAYQMPAPLQETHAFSFKRAGVRHYLFLAGAILIPVFILTTLVACIRTKISRRKWLWIIFVLVGMAQFSFNWTTGEFDVKFLTVQLLGAGILRASIYSPWFLMFSLPVGAIVFWFRRNMLEEWTVPTDPPSSPPPGSSEEPPPLSS